MNSKYFLVSIGFVLICGCTTTLPPPAPLDKERSVIGISVNLRAPIRLFSSQAQRVYFVRIESGEPIYQETVIPSNYTKGDYVYLLNAKPGRYATVAASYERVNAVPMFPLPTPGISVTLGAPSVFKSTTYFSEELIRSSTVELKPSTTAFMGELIIDTSVGVEGADQAQAHFYRLLEPSAEGRNTFFSLMSGEQSYRGAKYQSDLSDAAQKKFLDFTRQTIAEAGWTAVLQNTGRTDEP